MITFRKWRNSNGQTMLIALGRFEARPWVSTVFVFKKKLGRCRWIIILSDYEQLTHFPNWVGMLVSIKEPSGA